MFDKYRSVFVSLLLVSATALGLLGTDLVLPSIPVLPDALGGSPAQAQFVLAAFVAGAGVGLVVFGELGARFNQQHLLSLSLIAYGFSSTLAALASDLHVLTLLRFAQGASGAAAAVFAPGIIRSLFDEKGAIRMLGLLASVESLVPALAPVAGVGLLLFADWQASFILIAVLAFLLSVPILLKPGLLPPPSRPRSKGSYGRLISNPGHMRYSLSQATTLAGLLIFVFGAPAVFTNSLGGGLDDFIFMQVSGIVCFIGAANGVGHLTERHGPDRLIWIGSLLSAAGALAIVVYAMAGGSQTWVITVLFVAVNVGLGFRGPPGFYRAISTSRGDDARASALVLLLVLLLTATGTAAVAPFITGGLVPLSLGAAVVSVLSPLALWAMPRGDAGLPQT